MRLLLLLLLSFPAFAEYEFEKSKYQEGLICDGMVGTWYTDVITTTEEDGRVRHITKLARYADGSAQLKGLSIYIDHDEASQWAFPSAWSCDGEWYTEKNEWGYTSFSIVDLGENNVLEDALEYLGNGKATIVEKAVPSFNNEAIKQYFEND